MVLVSHIYRFIYIKNKKVAGSSVESFFGKYCTDPKGKYCYSDQIDQSISSYGIIGRRLGGSGNKWVSHKSAIEIKRDIGSDVFDKYLKFCVVRNPWDKMVSKYYWSGSKGSFEDFVKNNNANNWSTHTINGLPVSDFYIRFESLEEDIKNLCDKLGITDYDITKLPKHKSQTRKSDKHYRDYYTDETRNIVYQKHKKEIEFFGYEF